MRSQCSACTRLHLSPDTDGSLVTGIIFGQGHMYARKRMMCGCYFIGDILLWAAIPEHDIISTDFDDWRLVIVSVDLAKRVNADFASSFDILISLESSQL